MESGHPHLTTQKSFYVEISRARYRAELVTDNANGLKEHLEQATGERVAALEGIGARVERPAAQTRHPRPLFSPAIRALEALQQMLEKPESPNPQTPILVG